MNAPLFPHGSKSSALPGDPPFKAQQGSIDWRKDKHPRHRTMIFLVTPKRIKGRAITPEQAKKIQAVRGDLVVSHKDSPMGRPSIVAELNGMMPLDPKQLPDLLDVTLHSVVPVAMVLSGTEIIDGVAYAQSWVCRQE